MTEEKKEATKKAAPVERYIQMVAGIGMWAWLMWEDNQSHTDIAELSGVQLMLMFGKYAFAAILIKGISMAEVSEVIRAWKGK